jgi:hypothetical protein
LALFSSRSIFIDPSSRVAASAERRKAMLERKKLSLKHEPRPVELATSGPDRLETEHHQDVPRYHPAHDPQFVSDDEIPW